MTSAIPIMTDEEVRRATPIGEDAGFGSLATERGHLPLEAMDVDASIVGLASHVRLRQTFRNVFSDPLEATYIFPLPDRAGVTRFVMEVAGRVIEGQIKERQEARLEYTQAIQAGHRAAITEEERPGVFTMRVGNLMPNEVATVHLEMTGPLPYDEGESTFRFPLVVAPRYIPGRALQGDNVGDGVANDTDAVPDASRITPPILLPGYPNPVRLSLSIDLDGVGFAFQDVRTSIPVRMLSQEQGGRRRFTIDPGERLNRDFVMRWRSGDTARIGTSLALSPDLEGDSGTFMLTFVPPPSMSSTSKPRDIVFVLDRSGSMEGWKMTAARRAVSRMVETLSERDRFNVYAFDDRIESPPALGGTDLVAASWRNRHLAVEFLSKVQSRGGTEMLQPLYSAADRLAGGYDDRDRVLVLVTDGQIGNEDQIIREISKRQRNLRVFALGIDRAVNEGFLNRLAAIAGGMAEIVESEDRLDEVMDKMHRRIGTPLVTELRVVPTGLEIERDTIVPSRIPDLFVGAPAFIFGRYRGRGTRIAIEGKDASGRAWSESIAAETRPSPAIRTIWARGQVRELEDRFISGKGDRGTLERRIVDTSIRFGVLCRFTAYLAVDRAERVNLGGEVHRMVQPVEAPEGWAVRGSFTGQTQLVPKGGRAMSAASVPPPAPGRPAPAPMSMPVQNRAKADALDDYREMEQTRGVASKDEKTVAPSRSRLERAPELAKKKAPPREDAAVSLEAYRARAKEMLERLDEGVRTGLSTPGAIIAGLTVLTAHLKTLIEDLEAAGLESAALVLEPLYDGLKARLQGPVIKDDEARDLLDRTVAVLGAFAGIERPFWKL